MRRRDLLQLGGAGVLAAAMVGALAQRTAPAATAGARQVKDFRGKTIALKAPAQRVVCLIESALSGLYMLGAQHTLAGIPANVYSGDVAPHYAKLDPRIAAKKLPAPGNWDFISLEGIVALKPDLVIVWAQQREAIAAVEARGIPVYGVFIASMADLHKEITDFGVLTGTEARARQLLARTDAEVARITAAANAPEAERPRTYFAWGQGMLETACRGSMVDDMIRLAGGKNTCTDPIEHGKPSLERVLTWNPEVIILWPNERRTVASVLADPQWRNVAAIRKQRVHVLPEVFYCDLWTLKYQYALRLMAGWLQPQRMRDAATPALRDATLDMLYGRSKV